MKEREYSGSSNTTELLRQACLANPQEDTPRLMYCDKLQEDGQEEKAIELQSKVVCECAIPFTDERFPISSFNSDNMPPPGTFLTNALCKFCKGTGFRLKKSGPNKTPYTPGDVVQLNR